MRLNLDRWDSFLGVLFAEFPDLIVTMGANSRHYAEQNYDVRLMDLQMISEMQASMQGCISE